MSASSRLAGYVRPYAARIAGAALMLIVSGALMGLVVSTIKPLVNDVLLADDEIAASAAVEQPASGPDVLRGIKSLIPREKIRSWTREHAFVEVPLLLLMAYLLRSVLGYFGSYAMIRAGSGVIRDLRLSLFSSVASQSPGFFQLHPTGVILSRILNDVQVIRRVATVSTANALRVAAMIPFLLLAAFLHDWRMSLLVSLALPLLGWPMVRFGKKLRRAATASQENMAEMSHIVSEAVHGVRVVQSFCMESYEIGRFEKAINRVLRAELRAGRATSIAPSVMELFGAFVGALLFFVAGRGVAAGTVDPGNLTVVLVCLGVLYASTRRMNTFYSEVQRALASAERVFEMLDHPPAVVDRPGAGALSRFKNEIRFEDVSFSYGDETVLDSIDLTIRAGEVVALVGSSGAGKSTLASLLPRFYDVSHGVVRLDGQDISSVRLSSLREQIGMVTQETVLFDDTVTNNIAYGHRECDPERVRAVAMATQAHEFIERLPQGYDTMLGEGGVRLSMGQRQRLTIARALFKDPPILILDEATSSLDAESESLVQEALEVLMQGRTSLVIAHRLATVRRADRIIVLDGGRVIEQGTHDQLLERRGVYARLHALQFHQQAPA